MNASKYGICKSVVILQVILLIIGLNVQAQCQFNQEGNNSYFFIKTIEYDSVVIAELSSSKAKKLYYVQDTFAEVIEPLAKIHGKTCGTRYHRLDDQFKVISEQALKLGLNSVRVDSSRIDGTICEYWISLYRMNLDQIGINENIVMDNVLCVFGAFTDSNKLGKSFKINGRKMKLMPYEYVQRKIPHGKRGSVKIKNNRIELIGGIEGGEAFFYASGNPFSLSLSRQVNVGIPVGPLRLQIGIPFDGKNSKPENANLIPKTFAYFLYNIYNEKIVIAKNRDALVAAKRKEWREKKAAEEANKKAKELEKKKK